VNIDTNNLENNFHEKGVQETLTLPLRSPYKIPIRSENIAELSKTPQGKSILKENVATTLVDAVMLSAIDTAISQISGNDEADIRRAIFKACQQVQDPQNIQTSRLREILSAYPHFVCIRAVDQGNIALDGYTPLHCAAKWGNVTVIKLLLNEYDNGMISSWDVDLQGRTALHIAALNKQEEAVMVLQQAMLKERGINPVGEYAPQDLSGTTPLGLLSKRFGKKPSSTIEKLLFHPGDASILPNIRPATLLPATPLTRMKQCGRLQIIPPVNVPLADSVSDPASLPLSTHSRNRTCDGWTGFISGCGSYSAGGWRGYMEDRVFTSHPFILPIISNDSGGKREVVVDPLVHTSAGGHHAECREYGGCSLFGVFDGHGGESAVNFISSYFPCELERVWRKMGLSATLTLEEGHLSELQNRTNILMRASSPAVPPSICAQSEHSNSYASLTTVFSKLMKDVVLATDRALSMEPYMKVRIMGKDGKVVPEDQASDPADWKRFQAMDISGSTAVLCLVTSFLIVVANVGDSRAVLARRVRTSTGARLEAVPLSEDHKLSSSLEMERALAAGGMYVLCSVTACSV